MNYIIYARKSVSRNKEREISIQDQIQKCTDYVNARQGTILEVYQEVASGGGNGHNKIRKEMMKALDHCKKSNAILIMSTFDRFGRSMAFLDLVMRKKVVVEFTNLTIPPGANGMMMMQMIMSMAQLERERAKERGRSNYLFKKKNGTWKQPHNLTDEDRAKAAQANKVKALENSSNKRLMAQVKLLISSGVKTTRAIAKALNEAEFNSPKDGKYIYPMTVKRIMERI
jgi:DNA invertase Pin-like site-specific DNA recombinase